MSLNKWKTWPMENSEDMLKIDKKLVTLKRGSCDQFLAKIKFSKPDKAGDEQIWNFFLIDFVYGPSKSSFESWLRNRGQNGNNTRKIGHGSKDLM